MLRNSPHIFSGKALAHGAGALSRMAAVMRERMSPGIFVLMLAVFIGLVTGTMAVVLKWLVNYIVAKLTVVCMAPPGFISSCPVRVYFCRCFFSAMW